jgi:hypothetical protein
MDTGWIQVFVLTLAECVAPAGKSVCQEREFELQFLTQADCEYALEQLLTLKDESASVIVDKDASRCVASARRASVFTSAAEIAASHPDPTAWRQPDDSKAAADETRASHKVRLDSLKSCEETAGVAPCKVGEIIMEEAEAPDSVDVWRQQR